LEYDTDRFAARAALGDEQFAIAEAEGGGTTIDQILLEAAGLVGRAA
jgi:hypothetical protein